MEYTKFDVNGQREFLENALRGTEQIHLSRSLDAKKFQAYLDKAGEIAKDADPAVRRAKITAWRQSRDDALLDVATAEIDMASLTERLAALPADSRSDDDGEL